MTSSECHEVIAQIVSSGMRAKQDNIGLHTRDECLQVQFAGQRSDGATVNRLPLQLLQAYGSSQHRRRYLGLRQETPNISNAIANGYDNLLGTQLLDPVTHSTTHLAADSSKQLIVRPFALSIYATYPLAAVHLHCQKHSIPKASKL